MSRVERLAHILSVIDLTSLNDAQDDDITSLCAKAQSRHGAVAAVCSWPGFAGDMTAALKDSEIPVAVVVNFPSGEGALNAVRHEACDAVAAGARELDLVWPYRAWLAGHRKQATNLVDTVKAACGDAKLKVILESGVFGSSADLAQASREAIVAGADMLKTSTGKIPQGASLSASRVMLGAIRQSGRPVGFKASGGIRSVADAEAYLSLAEEIMGDDWPTAERFRIGASRLLDAILDEMS